MERSDSREAAGLSKSRVKIVACQVVIEEMLPILPEGVGVEILEMTRHENPARLRTALQVMIDASAGEWDTIILGYGMCSQATVGLHANGCQLVVPRVDDCIGMFLGSREAHIAQLMEEPGTYFLTRGWIGAGVTTPFTYYDRIAARWGPERAERLMGSIMKHYKRLVFIRTGDGERLAQDRVEARAVATRFNLSYRELDGTSALVERLLYGPWGEGFVTVPPGGTITLEDFLGSGRRSDSQKAEAGARRTRPAPVAEE